MGIEDHKACQVIRDRKVIGASSVRQDPQGLREKQASMVQRAETVEMVEMA